MLLHALYLFPINGLNDQVLFNSLVSYPVGSFVIDLIGLLACVYALVLAACVPLAARAFRSAPSSVRDTRLVMPV